MSNILGKVLLTKAWFFIFLTALVMLTMQGPQVARADHLPPPPDQQQTYNFTFSTSGQSMWGPGTEASTGTLTYPLIPSSLASWDFSINPRVVETIDGGEYGGGIIAGTEGSIGIDAEFSAGAGSIDVDAPMSLSLDFPAADSFRAGDIISITSVAPTLNADGAAISAAPPSAELGIVANVDLRMFIDAEICVSTCFETPFFLNQ